MPTYYNYTENGVVIPIDDIFLTSDAFRQGNLWTWGDNGSGQLGDTTQTDRSTPVTTFAGGANWKQVSVARAHTAAIKTDGTLWIWGNNYGGRIGDNTTTNRSTPVTTFAGGTNWKQVSGGNSHTAAIKTDGTLWTWGRNSYGQLGSTSLSTSTSTPITTSAGGTNWKQVSCRRGCTTAIKTDGTLWTWGENSYGQLGDNTKTNKTTPVTTFAGGTDWKQVSCGGWHTAAIKTDGTLWIWGENFGAKIGDNTTIDKSTPVTTFAGGTNWKQVACGGNHTAAIKTDGTLWIWGRNNLGQLGDNTTTNRTTPVTTFAGGTDWKQVACDMDCTFAIKTDGTLWGWGDNGADNFISSVGTGQLGNNGITVRTTPVTTFAGGTNWKQVSVGYQHTAAIEYIDTYQ